MRVPVTVAMGNAYYVLFCAHGNSHAHAHAYSHGHARDYVHGHVYYWQTRVLGGLRMKIIIGLTIVGIPAADFADEP